MAPKRKWWLPCPRCHPPRHDLWSTLGRLIRHPSTNRRRGAATGALLLVVLCLLVSPCPAVEVTDDSGRRVSLPAAAKRVISLSPHATELVYAAGGGPLLVAVAQFSDYPPAARALPRIGGLGGMDRERILALQPDLVVAWASGNKPGDIRWLRSRQIPVFLSEPRSLDDIASAMEKLGELMGTVDSAQSAAQTYRLRLESACSAASRIRPKTTYYEIWPKPAMTIGGRHWLNQVLQLAGLRNVFAEQPRAILNVEAESVLARPARVIVSPFPAAARPSAAQTVIPGPALLSRPGPRIPDAVRQLCQPADA